jgi:ribonuclease HII
VGRSGELNLFNFTPDPEELICGIDEAGRGSLAGPVVVAAVILAPGDLPSALNGLTDSKALSARQRDGFFEQIQHLALAVAVERSDPPEIDRLNILGATMRAMGRAALDLAVVPARYLVDGDRRPPIEGRVHTVVKGDLLYPCISAASVVAKVTRDRIMEEYEHCYPGYGFAVHKGYATSQHLSALEEFGPCAIHRRSFDPVRRALGARLGLPTAGRE